MADELPMFPLGTVLLPGAYLPLHVFEPRYREMVRVCLAGTPEFGVALIERGSEVGGGDHRVDAACVARIVEAGELDDGRWALGTVGVGRIRVVTWLPDAPYPRAEVEEWPDEEPGAGAGDLVAEVAAELRPVLALASEVGLPAAAATFELDDDPWLASNQLAALAPVGPLDRLALLAAPSPEARLTLVRQMVADEAAVLASRLEGG
jgi:Lon protease-like protein